MLAGMGIGPEVSGVESWGGDTLEEVWAMMTAPSVGPTTLVLAPPGATGCSTVPSGVLGGARFIGIAGVGLRGGAGGALGVSS